MKTNLIDIVIYINMYCCNGTHWDFKFARHNSNVQLDNYLIILYRYRAYCLLTIYDVILQCFTALYIRVYGIERDKLIRILADSVSRKETSYACNKIRKFVAVIILVLRCIPGERARVRSLAGNRYRVV